MKHILTLVALMTLMQPAAANESPLFAAGIGSTLGVSRVTTTLGATDSQFSSELSLRLQLFGFLGLDLAYSPTDGVSASDQPIFTNDLRLSTLIYVVPTPIVSGYAKLGIEGGDLGALFDYSDPSSSYHAGFGLDIHVTEHIVLSTELLFLFPGITSVENTVQNYVDQETARYQAGLKAGSPPTDIGTDAPEASDFLSADNLRFTIGARYYF